LSSQKAGLGPAADMPLHGAEPVWRSFRSAKAMVSIKSRPADFMEAAERCGPV
jgi:hypothetical protein